MLTGHREVEDALDAGHDERGPGAQSVGLGAQHLQVGTGPVAVGHDVPTPVPDRPGEAARPGVVPARDDEPVGGHGGDELGVRLLHPLGRAVVVEVVRLHVGHDRDVGAVREEGSVALVGLDDERVPRADRGVGAELGDLATGREARVGAGCLEGHDEHRRRRGLAVRAGNRNAPRATTPR